MADFATLLRDNVTLACRSIDRIFLQGYVPRLQSVGQVCRFLNGRGFNIPSSAAFGKIGDAYIDQIHRFAKTNDIPLIRFEKSPGVNSCSTRPSSSWPVCTFAALRTRYADVIARTVGRC
jgi:hypothetical protein